MAAFNTLLLENPCPKCGSPSVVAQFHVASSFDGYEKQRFCSHEYRVGDKLRWWPADHVRWNEWVVGGTRLSDGVVQECCYAECLNCGADLYAIVQFVDISPHSVVGVGYEKDWPAEFEK